MWMPALAGIIMRLVKKEGVFKGLNWNPLKAWRMILIAAFVPFTIEIISAIVTVGVGAAQMNPDFMVTEGYRVSIRGIALLLGAGLQSWFIFIPNFLLSFFVGTLFYSLLFAFGEEYGWRGYLQKQWAADNTKWVGFVAIGIVWGLWHLPGILLGHNFPDYPIIGGLLLMPLTCIAFSVVFGTVFNKTNVIWVPAIFHGAVNISAEMSKAAIIDSSIMAPVNDAIWIGLWVITGVICYARYIMSYREKIPVEAT